MGRWGRRSEGGPPWTPPPALVNQLQQRLGLRQDFLHQRTQLRNQRHALQHHPACDAAVAARLEATLAFLKEHLDEF